MVQNVRVSTRDRDSSRQNWMVDVAKASVVVRVRPTFPADDENVVSISHDGTTITLTNTVPKANGRRNEKHFKFDRIYPQNTSQQTLFQDVCRPLIDHVLNGFNSCCFAYGQTGAGKTYSMFGDVASQSTGLIPRGLDYLFKEIGNKQKSSPTTSKSRVKYKVFVSFMEIYLNRIRDLGRFDLKKSAIKRSRSPSRLRSRSRSFSDRSQSIAPLASPNAQSSVDFVDPNETGEFVESLGIREMQNGHVFVDGLSQVFIENEQAALRVIRKGLDHRQTNETALNRVSSRSHTIFNVVVIEVDPQSADKSVSDAGLASALSKGEQFPKGCLVHGQISFVDLAGSERLETVSPSKHRQRSRSDSLRTQEAVSINSSLTTLGKVVICLAAKQMKHIPFRESKLTRLLQNSLQGNSYTTLLATINPAEIHFEESVQTLLFAYRCDNIETKVHVNYLSGSGDTEELQRRIQILLAELGDVKQALADERRQSEDTIKSLIEKLQLDPDSPEHAELMSLMTHRSKSTVFDFQERGDQMQTFGGLSSPTMTRQPTMFSSPDIAPIQRSSSFALSPRIGGVNGNIDTSKLELMREQEFLSSENARLTDQVKKWMEKQHCADQDKRTVQREYQQKIQELEAQLATLSQESHNSQIKNEQILQTEIEKLMQNNSVIVRNMLKRLLKAPSKNIKSIMRQILRAFPKPSNSLQASFEDTMEGTNSREDHPSRNGSSTSWTTTGSQQVVPKQSRMSKQKVDKICGELQKQHEQEMDKMMTHFKSSLSDSRAESNKLTKQIETLQKSQSQFENEVSKELVYLYDCLESTTSSLEKLSNGNYTIEISSGVKTVRVDGKELVSKNFNDMLERCQTLQRLLSQTKRFMKRQSQHGTSSIDRQSHSAPLLSRAWKSFRSVSELEKQRSSTGSSVESSKENMSPRKKFARDDLSNTHGMETTVESIDSMMSTNDSERSSGSQSSLGVDMDVRPEKTEQNPPTRPSTTPRRIDRSGVRPDSTDLFQKWQDTNRSLKELRIAFESQKRFMNRIQLTSIVGDETSHTASFSSRRLSSRQSSARTNKNKPLRRPASAFNRPAQRHVTRLSRPRSASALLSARSKDPSRLTTNSFKLV